MKNPIVTIETNQGVIKVELYPDVAPNTVNNFTTAQMLDSASPRKPRLAIPAKSSALRILLVAWRRKAVRN